MKKAPLKRFLSALIVFAMLLTFVPSIPAIAQDDVGIRWRKTDQQVSIDLSDRLTNIELDEMFEPTDIVRVSIILEEKSTIQAGFSTMDIAKNAQAMAYNKYLQKQQETVVQSISRQALGGQALDVVWNLTLVGNIISANVPYGKISAIEKINGVAGVILENKYEPIETVPEAGIGLNQFASTGMTGSNVVWTNGYTGAGSRIAVIDTGTDTDHQSFDAGAFLYALEQNAAEKGLTFEEYIATLDLLDEEELANVLPNLNIYKRDSSLTAADLYLSEKLAFAVNYVDEGSGRLVVDHDSDYQSNHGSHVAGICTANRYIPADGGYVDAMETVKVAGVAPDAQLITMKVFGQNALVDSDYMAAIEDAILLGCDSVNLSLGTTAPGFAFNSYYAELLDLMANSDTVVVASAGNEGKWTDMTMFGTPYPDDVVFDTLGSPASYGNLLAVASVENDGIVGIVFQVAGVNVMYVENTGYGNDPMTSLDTTPFGSGTTYEYIFIDGIGETADYEGMDLTGKVVFCSRGSTNFADKANIAASGGAVALVVYNNADGDFGMNLTGYHYTAPAVSVSKAVGDYVRENSVVMTTDAGLTYYTGTMDIFAAPQAGIFHNEYYTMSDFSSWGVPGDLSIKPEITAPGGGIYSVYGSTPDWSGTAEYGLMSGTSMAAPQVAGMVALLAQYIRETGLDQATNISPRVLAHSLLMSTAVPMKDQYSLSYYSVIQQGAGLARVDLATQAGSYIMVTGQNDGKVKAELGDDPDRTGVYRFSFAINNLTGQTQDYALRAELFRQNVYDPGELYYGTPYGFTVQDVATTALASDAKFTSDGASVSSVTVPAGRSVTVEVELTLTDAAKQELDALSEDGYFVQGYVFAEQITDDETATNHSIPVLAFYGNWTDPNMFDRGTYVEMMHGISDMVPYLYQDLGNGNTLTIEYGDGNEYYYGGNPFGTDEVYMAERNAFNSEDDSVLNAQYYTLLRNAGYSYIEVVDQQTGEVYYTNTHNKLYPAYFNSYSGTWDNSQLAANLYWYGTDSNGDPLPEGTVVEVRFTAVPEYYENADGSYNLENLGHGATLTTQMTIDNTAPEMMDVQLDGTTLTVKGLDNNYVSAAALLNQKGTVTLAAAIANQTVANTEVEIVIDLSEVTGSTFLLAVYDYAMNVSIYEIELELPEIERPYFTVADYRSGAYYGLSHNGETVKLGVSDRGMLMAAEFVDGYVFEVSDGDKLYVGKDSDLNSFQYLSDLDPDGQWGITNFLDLAYNYADGKLYGLFYCDYNAEMTPMLCTIDMFTGEMDVLLEMPIDVNNLAIDGGGNFYSVGYATASLYTYTLHGAASGSMTYIGEVSYYATTSFNSLAWDHNTNMLYWAYPDTLLMVDPKTAEPTMLSYFMLGMVGLYIRPNTYDETRFAPVDYVTSVELDYSENRTMVGTQLLLSANVLPWNVSDHSVTWSTSDPDIATVDQNGMVTSHSAGTVIITATSNLDPTMSASCVVEVTALDKTLNGLLWDENGKIWWSEFDVDKLPEFEKLTDAPLDEYLASVAVAPDGTIYATTTDVSTGYLESALFTVDADTFALTKIGDIQHEGEILGASDIAYAPNLLGGTILGTYGSSLLVIDPATGAYIGDYTMFLYGLNAIAYVGSDPYQDYGFDTYIDWFFLIDTHGYVYLMGFLADESGNLYYLEHPVADGGIFTVLNYTTDTAYFGSAHFDGEYLYWSVYNAAQDVSTLFIIDTVGSRKAYNMGNFGAGIWPMGGLCELNTNKMHGDVNGDDYVDVEDAMMVLQYDAGLLEESDLDVTVGDVSGDGYVDVEDAMLILQYEVGLVETFPVEE